MLLVNDEPVLHLRDLFLEALDDVSDVSGLGEILGYVGPPAGDAAPMAVGLELAAGQLGDPIESHSPNAQPANISHCMARMNSRNGGHIDRFDPPN